MTKNTKQHQTTTNANKQQQTTNNHSREHQTTTDNSRQRYTATDHHKPEKATSHPISQPQPTRNNTRLLQFPAPAARVGLAQKSKAPSAPAKCRTLPPCDARPFPQQCCDRSVVLCTHWTYEPQKCIEKSGRGPMRTFS